MGNCHNVTGICVELRSITAFCVSLAICRDVVVLYGYAFMIDGFVEIKRINELWFNIMFIQFHQIRQHRHRYKTHHFVSGIGNQISELQ